mgnify:CR=1 FL=1
MRKVRIEVTQMENHRYRWVKAYTCVDVKTGENLLFPFETSKRRMVENAKQAGWEITE